MEEVSLTETVEPCLVLHPPLCEVGVNPMLESSFGGRGVQTLSSIWTPSRGP